MDNRWKEEEKDQHYVLYKGIVKSFRFEEANILDLPEDFMVHLWAWRTLHAGERL